MKPRQIGKGRGREPGARQEAKLAGVTRYKGGPCRRCGKTERYTSNGHCIACQAPQKRQWSVTNWRKKNPK